MEDCRKAGNDVNFKNKMKKIAIYYWHRDTLGHSKRVRCLAESLHRLSPKKTKIHLINGGAHQPFLQDKKFINYSRLPFPSYLERSCRRGRSGSVCIVAARERSGRLIKFIQKNKPDVFITENFPFGNPESFLELLPVLKYLKKNSIQVVSSSGYPYIAKEWLTRHKECLMLGGLYSKILIHTPNELENPYIEAGIKDNRLKENYRLIMDTLNDKIVYTGYVMPEESKKYFSEKRKPHGRKLIFVMRGAGLYFPAMICHAIMAKKTLGNSCDMLIAAGPTTEPATMTFYLQLMKKHGLRGIRLEKYISNPYPYIRDCDIACTMAGYNTSVLLLYSRKKSIVVPHEFKHDVSSEQTSRAMMLRDYLGSTILAEREVNSRNLADNMERLLSKKWPVKTERSLSPGDFNGGASTARFLMKRLACPE